MRAIMIMYDSLNRRYLSSYGCEECITPNFQRLSEHSVTFDQFYAGSLPCIPARRELQTGRYNFLHRNWGPMEPYDDSLPQILSEHGIYTHLVTDHCHYWQEGGATYHTRYSSCDMIRGQEGDFWKGEVKGFQHNLDIPRQDAINRTYLPREEDHPHVKTFVSGMEFLRQNVEQDNWFLQLEYFDPHEPYYVPQKYKDMYGASAGDFDWPYYGAVEDPEKVRQARQNYMALLTMCDVYLGKLLDFMDEHDMWKDTMLILNTDHGFILGEHGYFAKNYMPCYDEIVHIPFFLWDPRTGAKGQRCKALAQTVDIVPTILDGFSIPPTPQMQGRPLNCCAAAGPLVREYALFGAFGKHVNITDGRYVYMRSTQQDGPIYNYTIMPTNIFTPYSLEELRGAELTPGNQFAFTKGVPLMKIPTSDETAPQNSAYYYSKHKQFGTMLFDMDNDPKQEHPIQDELVEQRMTAAMVKMMKESEAPQEQFSRLGLGN